MLMFPRRTLIGIHSSVEELTPTKKMATTTDCAVEMVLAAAIVNCAPLLVIVAAVVVVETEIEGVVSCRAD